MSLRSYANHFVKQAGLGTQPKTGAGFQGKAQIAFPSFEMGFGWLADGNDTGYRLGVGFAASSTSRAYATSASEDAQTASNLGRGLHTDQLLAVPRISSGSTPSYAADFESFDADGYTWDWTSQNESGAYLIPNLVLGGDDLTVAKVVQWQCRSSFGTVTSPSIGGSTKLALFSWNGRNTNSAPTGLGGRGAWGIGAMNSAGEQFALWGYSLEGANPTDTQRSLLSDHCFLLVGAGGVSRATARFNAVGADDFTVEQDDPVDASDLVLVNALALCGTFQSKITTFSKPTGGNGSQNTVNVGFPWHTALFFTASSTTSDATVDAHNRGSVGFFDGTNMRCKAWTEQDNVSPSSVREYLGNTEALAIANNDSGSLDAALTGVVADGNNAVHTWGTNHAEATRVTGIYLGDAAPAEPPRRARAVVI